MVICLCGRVRQVRRGFVGRDRDDVAKACLPPLEVGGGPILVDLTQLSLAQLMTPEAAARLPDRPFAGVAVTAETLET